MAKIASHPSNTTVKMLFFGDSGSGKTGALVSLLKAGYKLFVLDFDNGLDSLIQYARAEAPDKLNNIEYETLTNRQKIAGGVAVPDGAPKAFSKGMELLTRWKYKTPEGETIDLGITGDLDPSDTVVVIDSLTFMSNAALDYVLYLQGRAGKQPQIQDWGEAMRMIEGALKILYSNEFKPNLIITSHVSYIGEEGGMLRGYPSTLGQKLPPKVGRYFNAALMARVKGTGGSAKRIIRTKSEGVVELKNPVSLKVPVELPLETGLAEYFKFAKGGK